MARLTRSWILIFALTLNMSWLAYAQLESPDIPTIETPQADQTWSVCNETSYLLNIATMTTPLDGDVSQARVRGWVTLRSGACQAIEARPGAPRFVYARSDIIHQGDIHEWKGQQEYCIGDKDFVATIDLSCSLQNLTSAQFLQVPPSEPKTYFIEPSNYKSKAETAGLQRLLRDNGYKIARIDGIGGARTRKSLNQFLKDNDLDRDSSIDEQFTALEHAARVRLNSVGITFCNATKTRIWTAIAYDTGEWWKSLGWWELDPEACVRPFSRDLKTVDSYIYARQETIDGPDKPLYIAPEDTTAKRFCIAQSKFSAISHEFCSDHGYVSARFKAMETDQSGQRVNFTDEDFIKPLVDGLRR